MLISPKSCPFSIDSLLGIKDVDTAKNNENILKPDSETEFNSKDKTVIERKTSFEKHQVDRNLFQSLKPAENSLHLCGKSDYNINSDHAFRFISERHRELFVQRQSEQLEYCRMKWWEPNRHRDHYSPWSYRYPIQGPLSRYIDPSLLLPSLRKSKRVRTAFSPTQLLQLEHAFEKNHYVVGQERKELALKLGLSETQVKVWFQNRRTKFKRAKAEEDMTKPFPKSKNVAFGQLTDISDTHNFDSASEESDIDV